MSRKDVLEDVLRALSKIEHKEIIDIHKLAKETRRDFRTIRGWLELIDKISKSGVLIVKYDVGNDAIYYTIHFAPLRADIQISNEKLILEYSHA